MHLDVHYPDAERDLGRFLPLIKWLLAIPHYIVLAALAAIAVFAVITAWFAILFTGRHPRPLFDFVVGVARWGSGSTPMPSCWSRTSTPPSASIDHAVFAERS